MAANKRSRGVTTNMAHLCVALMLPIAVFSQSASHWNTLGEESLENALNLKMNTNVAKNIIFFLGDGLDIITSTASRIYKGQQEGRDGEEGSLLWETFPHVALSKTYNTDYQVPDSAGTATAFLTGVKTKMSVIGYDDKIETSVCASTENAELLTSILDDAIAEGKLAGIVTTTRLTHATIAAGYAHTPDRNWESDKDLTEEAIENGCVDIASQLINSSVDLRVTMGGGRRAFFSVNLTDPEYPDSTGNRLDERNLTDEWVASRTAANLQAKYVWNLGDFKAVNPDTTDALLGLFEPSHMQYEKYRNTSDEFGEPSIAEMTEKAIQILSKDEDGFFLLVEGGRIDHGHHEGIAHIALTETLALEEALERALDMVDTDETLVIVTGDHGHVMSIAGYPTRGNPILGLVDGFMGEDGLPYTTLGYQNGFGARRVNESFHETDMRPNLTLVDTEDPAFIQDALVPLYAVEETHGGQDVAIYATGPLAHLFHGVQEQSYIAHVMRYASCLGKNKNHCKTNSGTTAQLTTLTLFTSTILAYLLN